MKKYMIVSKTEDGESAIFTDDSLKAEQIRMDIECGLGGRVQVYKWYPRSQQYKLWYE